MNDQVTMEWRPENEAMPRRNADGKWAAPGASNAVAHVVLGQLAQVRRRAVPDRGPADVQPDEDRREHLELRQGLVGHLVPQQREVGLDRLGVRGDALDDHALPAQLDDRSADRLALRGTTWSSVGSYSP